MKNEAIVSWQGISTYKLVVNMELIQHRVPNSMKLFGTIMAWEFEIIATTITSREFRVYSAERMKWLMNVSKIMDQKS
jgi:hypothetical protein